ncbi:MAG: exodeoxyribonuclease V subunit gamma [Clostridia bacterium]|nr:exodeoxyribonuclease V subunit gamma [Clostridia bacterium]
MVKLITTDSYQNVFNLLNDCLSNSANSLDGENLIFCEEKISLMVERLICERFGGSFNTEVYSFGNFLRVSKPNENALSKEGSAMVVQRILSSISLDCFRGNKSTLAPTLFELIIQLKSANVTPDDLIFAMQKTNGVLKNKLSDIAKAYTAYENYLLENGYEDQSSMLSYLPEILENSQRVAKANVYVVGFTSFTSQTRSAVRSLIKTAKNVTAILVEGQNDFAFVNETSKAFELCCQQEDLTCIKQKSNGNYLLESNVITQNLFNPKSVVKPVDTKRVHYLTAKNTYEEIERVAESIKKAVMNGEIRYRQAVVALADADTYREHIKACFDMLSIPYFLDEKKKPAHHPLVLLILNYVDIFRKGFESESLCAFFKNPLICKDKAFADAFERYLKKYNLFYSAFKSPFAFDAQEFGDTTEFEKFRVKINELFTLFNPIAFLEKINAKEQLEDYSRLLEEGGEAEESAITLQIYGAVEKLLTEISAFLGGVNLSYTEYKNVLLGGINALELSIIPQYNDAVFIGGYKEVSLRPASYLYAVGLTSEVPSGKEDVALISDAEIDALADLKVMIEPKIRVVNHRVKESLVLGLGAFSEKLFLSYPLTSKNGGKNSKSEVLAFMEEAFNMQEFPKADGFLTDRQSLLSYAKSCSDFYDGKTLDIEDATSYYYLCKDQNLNRLAMVSGKELKIRLEENKRAVIKDVTSPTTIEDYYKCPYRAFLSHGLRLKEQDEGSVNALSYGNLMHELFAEYLKNISKVYDKQSSDALFDSLVESLLARPEYKRFEGDGAKWSSISRALLECKKFCFKCYLASQNSEFKTLPENVEVSFGREKKGVKSYPAISLNGGKVKLTGKIDRVDTCGDYCRVIDYKTGSADASNDKLFAGLKLQLYLYGAAVSDKKLAGMYYLPVNDSFKAEDKKQKTLVVGKTLDDVEVVHKQDTALNQNQTSDIIPVEFSEKNEGYKGVTSKENLDAMVEYALKISEKAAEQMQDGVIVASPYEKTCEHCPYVSMCQTQEENVRKVKSVSDDTFYKTIKGEDDAQT